ncbi:coproporphyrinogen III oxidase, anaerobic [Faunimonas pinastri]|uniref:Coproporphyrinogen-III oxidase n=1 Tax=Faunimonas pinastri TaxID=1855383 RepID=A0A1H9A704_9HYPH|nr:oxygen-independent coproporphyrinogen III oxidase [Faunimonas pinastri]SEP72267.1 coproporphyrinogen III oxidase, anaerobic [Faunimonas pinastri]
MSELDLVRRYGTRQVPRYTSYPTAVEFSASVGAAEHQAWLGNLQAGQKVSIYLHVPYCRELCHYCGCHTKLVHREDMVSAYGQALRTEIEMTARFIPEGVTIARLHWGGGTPTILGGRDMAAVVATLARHFTFDGGTEHAVELDPRRLGADLARQLADLGVNRASLGVQDLDARVQEAIGRVQPLEVVAQAAADLRQAGIERLNLDLIYGLPHQTSDSISETARQAIGLDPSRIACYGYAHLPSLKAHQRLIDETALPGPDERFLQSRTIAESFAQAGFQAIGIDHFARADDSLAVAAREGRLHRNFQGYTDDDLPVLIGFGASSISSLADGYVQNISDVMAYRRELMAGRLPTARGYRLDEDDRRRAGMIERLMCDFRLEARGEAEQLLLRDAAPVLAPLEADGLIVTDEDTITVTDRGRPFVRLAAVAFDAYRQGAAMRFSRAV